MQPDCHREHDTLAALWPELTVSSIRSLGEGWMSRAVLVNEQLVFRFAKHDDAARDVQKELALLPRLLERLSLPIPCFEFVGTAPSDGLPVVGYRALPGAPLGEAHALTLSKAARAAMAEQLGRFLDELHGFPAVEATALGVPVSDFRALFGEDRLALRAAHVKLEPDVLRYLEARFDAYLGEEAHFRYTPTLLHADLSPDHLLADDARERLTGIIDFGDASVGDPDYEYLYLSADLGAEFAMQVMRARGAEPSEARMFKIGLFQTFDHVHSILGGVHYGRRDLIEEGAFALTQEARKR